jgi:hypothetical protein
MWGLSRAYPARNMANGMETRMPLCLEEPFSVSIRQRCTAADVNMHWDENAMLPYLRMTGRCRMYSSDDCLHAGVCGERPVGAWCDVSTA